MINTKKNRITANLPRWRLRFIMQTATLILIASQKKIENNNIQLVESKGEEDKSIDLAGAKLSYETKQAGKY